MHCFKLSIKNDIYREEIGTNEDSRESKGRNDQEAGQGACRYYTFNFIDKMSGSSGVWDLVFLWCACVCVVWVILISDLPQGLSRCEILSHEVCVRVFYWRGG